MGAETDNKPHTYPRWSKIHYNALAKEIRELFPDEPFEPFDHETSVIVQHDRMVERAALTALALNLAKRFKKDRDESLAPHYEFDPIKFLDACSPNTDLYPLSEMWDEDA